jgi:hypothetical protein
MQAPLRIRQNQQGFSFLGFVFLGAIVIAIAILAMQVFPSANEYMAVKRAINKVSGEGGDNPAEIRRKFDQSAAIDDIVSIKGADLDVTKDGSDVVISFKYEKRIPLVGPASLVIDYAGTSKGGR